MADHANSKIDSPVKFVNTTVDRLFEDPEGPLSAAEVQSRVDFYNGMIAADVTKLRSDNVDENGVFRWRAPQDWPAAEVRAIHHITFTDDGVCIQLVDKLRAMDALAKLKG